MSDIYKDIAPAYADAIRNMMARPPGPRLTRWSKWNQVMGGFGQKQYTILCGPTGAGKTQLLANMSAQLLFDAVPHYVMPIEVGSDEYVGRVMAAIAGEDLLLEEPLSERTACAWHARFGGTFAKGTMKICQQETRMKVETLIDHIRRQYETYGTQVVFIDNLNYLLEVVRAADMLVEMDRVTHMLIEFVKSLPIHIVMVMHPKKTEEGRVVSEFDIKGSSTAVQEAQNVLLFNRRPKRLIADGVAQKSDREITLVKSRRRGRHVGKTILYKVIEAVQYHELGLLIDG